MACTSCNETTESPIKIGKIVKVETKPISIKNITFGGKS